MIALDVDPGDVGFSADRLTRISTRFRRYVDEGLLPGWLVSVTRGGKVAYLDTYGSRDIESGAPVELDTVFRLYSMTKPITSVAAMALYEEGAFELKDPVSRFIPAFADMRVYKAGSALNPETVPATEPIRMWHLLTHTAGLTYGFMHASPIDAIYRREGFEWGQPEGFDLARCCETWASLPLLFQPGAEWSYSVATDVLGRVVEVLSGQTLADVFAERIFGPLEMTETGFWARSDQLDRMASLYSPMPGTRRAVRNDAMGAAALTPPDTLSGGGGLVGTAGDYQRFASMLAGGGALDGVRILSDRTVRYMATNHLPGNADLTEFGRPLFSETAFDGIGFGLGVSVVIDRAATKTLGNTGEFGWGGAASTAFWVDPAEEVTVLFLTQLLPSSTHPLRTQLRQLVNQALVD